MNGSSAVSSLTPPSAVLLAEPEREPCCTRAKVKKVALYALAVFATCLAGFQLYLAIAGVSVISSLCWFVLNACWAESTFRSARNVLDFSSPKAIAKMREEAKKMTFVELCNRFGVLRVRDYELVSLNEFEVRARQFLHPTPA
jgi:hypothetical protein